MQRTPDLAGFAIAAVFVSGLWFGLYKLSARTKREIRIPVTFDAFPRTEVRDTLERLGCRICLDEPDGIVGKIPGDSLYWGQEITATLDGAELLVRSSFRRQQAFGGRKNQENVDRFRTEWQKQRL
jgi:hypothetical protein